MNQENRKRRVAIVTPPDVRNLTRTPSPKRHRNEGENRHIAKNSYNGDGEHVTSNFIGKCALFSEHYRYTTGVMFYF